MADNTDTTGKPAKTVITTTDDTNKGSQGSPWNKPADDTVKTDDTVKPTDKQPDAGAPDPSANVAASLDPAATDDREAALTPAESGQVRPLEELMTPKDDGGTEPTGGDGRPDAFLPGDQTAAGHLTPEGGRHPGGSGQADPLDPYNVNGGNALYHQARADNARLAEQRAAAFPAPTSDEPPEGTPMTPEEREANGLPPLENTGA